MNFQLVLFGSLIAFVTHNLAADAGTAQLLLRSCDHNADNALNAAEFAGCLMQQSRQQRVAASRTCVTRPNLKKRFMDKHIGLRTEEAELNLDAVISQTIVVLQNLGNANYSGAINDLYTLISEHELPEMSLVLLNFAIAALFEENYDQAINYVFIFIEEVAGGNSHDGVQYSTATNVAALLVAVIKADSVNIAFHFSRSLTSIIVDYSSLSQESARVVAALFQAVIDSNSTEFFTSLEVIVNDPNISSEAVNALSSLNNSVSSGSPIEVSEGIFAVLSTLLESENKIEIAHILVAVIRVFTDGDSEEAIEQITLLYATIIGSANGVIGLTSSAIVAIASIIKSLKARNITASVAQIDALIESINSGLCYVKTNDLRNIIQTIEAENYDEAIADIVAISTSESSVEISVEVFVALSTVINFMDDYGDTNGTITSIKEILNDSLITITVEIRSALRALITVLSEGTTEEALRVITVIVTGSSQAFEREISPQVAAEVELSNAAISVRNLTASIAIVEVLLRGERGGSSLSIVVKDDLKKVLSDLKNNVVSYTTALLTVISAGGRSSSFTSSALAALVVALHPASPSYTGSVSHSIVALEPVLQDDDLDSSTKAKIQAIIDDINDGKYTKAMAAMVIAMSGPGYSLTPSTTQSLFNALQLTTQGHYAAAIMEARAAFDELSGDVRLPLIFLIHLLEESHAERALVVLSVLLSQTS